MRVGTGSRVPDGHHRVRGDGVRLRRQLVERGDDRLDELIAVERNDEHLGPTVGRALDDPERQVVEQLVGQHDAVEGDRGELVERGDDRAHAGDGLRRVVVGAHDRAERVFERLHPEQLVLRLAERRGAFDQHVPECPFALGLRREHVAASRPRPAPTSTTRKGSGPSNSRHQPSSARATSAPNSGPTSGLVTKSRPARPAPPARVKKPSSP